jgi:hypothetical protein
MMMRERIIKILYDEYGEISSETSPTRKSIRTRWNFALIQDYHQMLDDESNIVVDKIMDYVEQKSTGAVKGPVTGFSKLVRKYLANIYNIRIKRTFIFRRWNLV